METSITQEDADLDVLGPVDYVVVEFPADKADFSGAMAAELLALVGSETIAVLDLLLIRKDMDGSFDVDELHEIEDTDLGALREFETEVAMLLAEEDVVAVAEAMEPGSIAAVLVYENKWAAPFASAVRKSGGQLVANGRIPVQGILAAIEAGDDTTEQEGA